MATTAPIKVPPIAETSKPKGETPPLVPGGTRLKVVMSIGGVLERMPSSEASVSPRQHAKCLFKRLINEAVYTRVELLTQ